MAKCELCRHNYVVDRPSKGLYRGCAALRDRPIDPRSMLCNSIYFSTRRMELRKLWRRIRYGTGM